jgi:predicted nucleotidyltransferase
MTPHAAMPQLAPRVQAYLAAITEVFYTSENALASVILFGSATVGGDSPASDVDLVFVLNDDATSDARIRLRDRVIGLEISHGLREPPRRKGALEAIADVLTKNDSSFFICTRADLLSGLPGRILNLPPAQALFVDRIVIPGILATAVTFQGEELLADVPVEPIRRFDVFKAFFGLFCQIVMSVGIFPFVPGATRYAMTSLKHSVRNCYFCYKATHASLEDEIEFLQKRSGPHPALDQLLALRRAYASSFGFVVRCMPALVRLHWRTALDNRFPHQLPRGPNN